MTSGVDVEGGCLQRVPGGQGLGLLRRMGSGSALRCRAGRTVGGPWVRSSAGPLLPPVTSSWLWGGAWTWQPQAAPSRPEPCGQTRCCRAGGGWQPWAVPRSRPAPSLRQLRRERSVPWACPDRRRGLCSPEAFGTNQESPGFSTCVSPCPLPCSHPGVHQHPQRHDGGGGQQRAAALQLPGGA